MRKLITTTFVTLDGIMQAPGGPEEDETGSFKYGGWSVNYWDKLMEQIMGETLSNSPDLLLGRKTYEIFAAYWPNAKDEPGADILNGEKKYVVSRSLDRVDWNNSFLIKGDVVKEIKRLKEMDGPQLQVHGSGNLIQTLLRHDLIDEMHLWVFPVVIGTGKRLFGEGTHPAGFTPLRSTVSSTGVIIAVYQQSGKIITGSFALDND